MFPAGYLTALAIIQGVALGILLTNTQGRWPLYPGPLYHLMISAQALGVFSAITVVTHRYTLNAILTTRMPTLSDTLIPYTLGVGEIGAAQLIGYQSVWWAGVLAFSAAAITAYLHSRSRMERGIGGGGNFYTQFRRITRNALVLLSALALVSAAMLSLGVARKEPAVLYAVSPFFFTMITVLIEVLGRYKGIAEPGSSHLAVH